LVKINKQKVEKIERNIQKINSSINNLNNRIKELEELLSSFVIPKKGDFSYFNQIKSQQFFIREEINRFKNQIMVLKSRKKELFEELKKANIEYEKVKYLQMQEIKKNIKKNKLKEAREMDEIAILLRNLNEKR